MNGDAASGFPPPLAPASFRDPSGRVYLGPDAVYRTIGEVFIGHWSEASGFAAEAAARGWLCPYETIAPFPGSRLTLKVPRLPFISYPYEWCFSQLKDAALLTLELLREADARGLTLKDASAYNVQFQGSAPIFIDHLSFEKAEAGRPWAAYLQFCRHFLGPLALLAYRGHLGGRLSALWSDGPPLDVIVDLLPWRTWLSPWLLIHLHLHRRVQRGCQDARRSAASARAVRLGEGGISRLAASLIAAVEGLPPPARKTEWGAYYQDTNYTPAGAEDKARLVSEAAASHPGALALDLGANTGRFSRLLAPHFTTVLAADLDCQAVDNHYLHLKAKGPANVLPLMLDLANPTPALGWAEEERDSFARRVKADFLSALALLHHLVFSAGIPLAKVADYLARLLNDAGCLLLEFVPLEDSQVRRLLAARENVFPEYHLQGCLEAFSRHFTLESRHAIRESSRTLLVWRKRSQAS
jgi:ribosomal protein L11 methylase PrmA